MFTQHHWSFWIFCLFGVIFLFWLFFGGGNYEYVGWEPLGVEAHHLGVVPDHLGVVPDQLGVSPIQDVGRYLSIEEDLLEIITCPEEEVGPKPPLVIYDDTTFPKVPLPEKPSRWKRQEACCRGVEEIFGLPFRRDVRDLDWLYNPETGSSLELDCYNDELKIAVEHNGEHHYKYPNHWNKTKEEWIEMVRRDKLKPEQCDKNGVYLITIPYWVPFHKIKDVIRQQLKPLIQARNAPQ